MFEWSELEGRKFVENVCMRREEEEGEVTTSLQAQVAGKRVRGEESERMKMMMKEGKSNL